MSTDRLGAAESREERLYDEHLDALLRGEREAPEDFLARHREAAPTLRERPEALHRKAAEDGGRSRSGAAPVAGERLMPRSLPVVPRGGCGGPYCI